MHVDGPPDATDENSRETEDAVDLSAQALSRLAVNPVPVAAAAAVKVGAIGAAAAVAAIGAVGAADADADDGKSRVSRGNFCLVCFVV